MTPNSSTSGEDTFKRVRVMYYHHKRQIKTGDAARLMNECTGYSPRVWRYKDSHCDPHGSIRNVLVFCRHLLDTFIERSIHQVCGPTEICIQRGPLLSRRAYCVSVLHFLEVETASQQHPRAALSIEAPQTGGHSQSWAAEAILTDSTTNTLLQAQSMELRAFVETRRSNVPVLQEAMHGRITCQDCGRVELDPIPNMASVLTASVKGNEEAGILYLATVAT